MCACFFFFCIIRIACDLRKTAIIFLVGQKRNKHYSNSEAECVYYVCCMQYALW